MKVTLYFAGALSDKEEVNLEDLINDRTIELQRVPNIGEEMSLMFDKYWINAKVELVQTDWIEPGNQRFKERAWGDHYVISLADIEIMEEYE